MIKPSLKRASVTLGMHQESIFSPRKKPVVFLDIENRMGKTPGFPKDYYNDTTNLYLSAILRLC